MSTLAARVTIQNDQHPLEVNYQKSTNKLQLRDLDNLRLPHTYLALYTHNFFLAVGCRPEPRTLSTGLIHVISPISSLIGQTNVEHAT